MHNIFTIFSKQISKHSQPPKQKQNKNEMNNKIVYRRRGVGERASAAAVQVDDESSLRGFGRRTAPLLTASASTLAT
jgi:hypothetical protein